MLSGEAWTSICIVLHLEDVTLELLRQHRAADTSTPETSLAKIDFVASRLTFDSFSDGTKDVDLVSLQICIYDTRYTGEARQVQTHSTSQTRSNISKRTLQLKPLVTCVQVYTYSKVSARGVPATV